MALTAEQVPENDARRFELIVLKPHQDCAFCQKTLRLARLAEAGEITLHIGQGHQCASAAKRFCLILEGDGLSGTSGTGDEAMTISQFQR